MAVELGWRRRFAFLSLTPDDIARLLGEPVVEAVPLAGGLRNTNYRLRLASRPEPVVLRLYTADDPLACAREQAVLRLVEPSVPAPRVLRAAPDGEPPWALLSWIDGPRLDEVLGDASPAEAVQLAASAGAVLAGIHAFSFPRGGFFGPNLEVQQPLGVEHDWAVLIDGWVVQGRAGQRLGSDLTTRLMRFVDRSAAEMQAARTPPVLVHADYKPWNLITRGTEVTGVLDWEFPFAGPKLLDVGIFLRQRDHLPAGFEAAFFGGYEAAGGTLPHDAARLSRMLDLVCLAQLLDGGDQDDPQLIVDLRAVVEATLRAYA